MNDTLLTDLLALLESTKLHDLVGLINQDTKAVRLKLLVDVEMLAPEKIAFVLSLRHFVSLDELGRSNQLIGDELVDVEDEGFVLLNGVVDVLVHLCDLCLHTSEDSEVVLDFLLFLIADGSVLFDLPGCCLVVLSKLGRFRSLFWRLYSQRVLFTLGCLGYIRRSPTLAKG